MAGSAGALGGVALGSTFATGAFAQDDEDGGEAPEAPPQGNATEGEFEDDLEILNYALTLEHLEAEFYNEALDNLDDDAIHNSEALGDFDGPVVDRVVDELETIRDHEVAHVDTLTAVVGDLGGDPVEAPTFDFGGATQDADAFLETAMALENTGVAAYAGAAPSIENADVVPPALSIHSVEARHASFVNVLNGESGFPEAYDDPLSRAEVLDIASDFIVQDDENGEDGGDAENGDDSDDGGC
ncbi:ferritin-like domain-containing protein [Natronomonas salina]|nr:ferritin-like domain-containing protein [Natronomonas salina]